MREIYIFGSRKVGMLVGSKLQSMVFRSACALPSLSACTLKDGHGYTTSKLLLRYIYPIQSSTVQYNIIQSNPIQSYNPSHDTATNVVQSAFPRLLSWNGIRVSLLEGYCRRQRPHAIGGF